MSHAMRALSLDRPDKLRRFIPSSQHTQPQSNPTCPDSGSFSSEIRGFDRFALPLSTEGAHTFTSTVVDFEYAKLQAFAEPPFSINLISHYLCIISSRTALVFIKIDRRLVHHEKGVMARDVRSSGRLNEVGVGVERGIDQSFMN